MDIYADLHIHTALSPCADSNMTPNNIVNMAKLKGLEVIGITDHNSCENVESCIGAASKIGLTVVPGMELQTIEDIHVVCLFKSIEKAYDFQDYVYKHLPDIKNRPDIFGEQIVFDRDDNILGNNEKMLLSSTDIAFDEAFEVVRSLNGLFIPAHIDRNSFSVLYSLGFMPDYLTIKLLEYCSEESIKEVVKKGMLKDKYKFIKSSDAHYLHQILEREEAIRINNIYSKYAAEEVLKKLEI